MRRLLWMVILPVGLMALGCGRPWRNAQARAFSKLTLDLQEWIDLNDPHRDEVRRLIEAGWMASWEGRVGWFGAIPFQVAFEQSTSDGMFDDAEVKLLREKAEQFEADPVDQDRRTRLLALKADMDAQIKAERHRVNRRRGRLQSEGGALSNWQLPDDLRDATESAGWELDGPCREDEIDGIQFVFCEGVRNDMFAEIRMDRYPRAEDARAVMEAPGGSSAMERDGDTVLIVRVLHGPAAEGLRDAIVAKGDRLDRLSAGSVQASIRGRGWDLVGCDAHKEGRTVTVTCEANQHQRQALVDLVVQRGVAVPVDEDERILSSGEASVLQGPNQLRTVVYDPAPAAELAAAIID